VEWTLVPPIWARPSWWLGLLGAAVALVAVFAVWRRAMARTETEDSGDDLLLD
jgi:membrane protein implicated in regulation of membrane protease activity